jgi:hypothetical protein
VLKRGDQFGAFLDGLIVLGFFPPSADGFSIDFLITHHNGKALSGLDVRLPEPKVQNWPDRNYENLPNIF